MGFHRSVFDGSDTGTTQYADASNFGAGRTSFCGEHRSLREKQTRRIMILIDAAVMTLILANCLANLLAARWNPSFVMLRTAISVYDYPAFYLYRMGQSKAASVLDLDCSECRGVPDSVFSAVDLLHHRRRDLASRSTGLFRSLGQFHTACSHDDHPSDSVQERQRN